MQEQRIVPELNPDGVQDFAKSLDYSRGTSQLDAPLGIEHAHLEIPKDGRRPLLLVLSFDQSPQPSEILVWLLWHDGVHQKVHDATKEDLAGAQGTREGKKKVTKALLRHSEQEHKKPRSIRFP